MKHLFSGFGKGLLLVVPLAVTLWVVYAVITFVDDLLRVPIPGLGIVITFVVISLLGLLASNAIGHAMFSFFEASISKIPIVKLVYSSLKDLLSAFVGDKKSFDQPVFVELGDLGETRVLGFLTCKHFDDPNLIGYVAVYLPQSYNLAGNLIVVKKEKVHHIDADGAQFMAFLMSGGVAEMQASRTVMDLQIKLD